MTGVDLDHYSIKGEQKELTLDTLSFYRDEKYV